MNKEQAIIYLSSCGIDEDHIRQIKEAFSQEPQFFPPCVDCNMKMDEIRRAYDNVKASERGEKDCLTYSIPLPNGSEHKIKVDIS